MTNFWDDPEIKKSSSGQSKFYSLKEGETITMNIAFMERSPASKFKPKRKDGREQEWGIILRDENGKELSVGSFALQGALMTERPNVGDTIEISHPRRGEYIVKKLF